MEKEVKYQQKHFQHQNLLLSLLSLFFFQLLYLKNRVFFSCSLPYVANLARLGISVCWQVSVRFQYLVRLLSQCWITDGHTIHPPIEGLLLPTGIEPTSFRNSASKVAGLQMHGTTPGSFRNQFKMWSAARSNLFAMVENNTNPSFPATNSLLSSPAEVITSLLSHQLSLILPVDSIPFSLA